MIVMFEEINEIAGFKITDFEILDVVDDINDSEKRLRK